MKKVNVLFAMLLVAFMGFIASCSSDEEKVAPTINVSGQDASSYTVGDTIHYSLIAGSSTELKALTIEPTSTGGLGTGVKSYVPTNALTSLTDWTFVKNQTNVTIKYDYVVPANTTSVTITFTVTDKDHLPSLKESGTKTFTVTPLVVAGEINAYTAILMGGQLNATYGSFWSSIDQTVYTITNAVANSAKIDLLYFYGETNEATLAGPTNDQAIIAFAGFLATLTEHNATTFKDVTTAVTDWAAVTDDAIITANATAMTATLVNHLTVGKILAFKTASTSANPNKSGLIKVVEITGTTGTDRAIKLDIKIQK